MGILEAFGDRVRQFRNARGMSQQELADKTGLHRNYVGKVEKGEKNISLLNMCKIAAELRVDLADLIKDVELK